MNSYENNPFFSKIMYEEQFCQNDCFGIVADADPITAGHYMIYSKIFKPSVADCDYLNAATFIREAFLPKVEVPYAYFERGRASFCTSMQGVKHAHAHLVAGVPHLTEDEEIGILRHVGLGDFAGQYRAHEPARADNLFSILQPVQHAAHSLLASGGFTQTQTNKSYHCVPSMSSKAACLREF